MGSAWSILLRSPLEIWGGEAETGILAEKTCLPGNYIHIVSPKEVARVSVNQRMVSHLAVLVGPS